MKNIGLVSGLAFGLVAAFLAMLGLVSVTVEMISPLLLPAVFLFRGIGAAIPGALVIAIILNIALFGAIGYLLQRAFKREIYVAYLFGGIVALVIILVVIEQLTRGLSA